MTKPRTPAPPRAPRAASVPISPVPPSAGGEFELEDGPDVPDFLPWFPQRRSAGGWTPVRQRAFLGVLARTGSVPMAAEAVGKSARSARQLRDKPGAEHFAVVWDAMSREGHQQLRAANFERAMHGELVPVFRKGHYRGVRLRYPDRIAVAVLQSGRSEDAALALDAERDRLWKWEIALRRRELDLPGGDDHALRLRTREAHALWMKALADERRRLQKAEYRALARKALHKQKPEPRIRFL